MILHTNTSSFALLSLFLSLYSSCSLHTLGLIEFCPPTNGPEILSQPDRWDYTLLWAASIGGPTLDPSARLIERQLTRMLQFHVPTGFNWIRFRLIATLFMQSFKLHQNMRYRHSFRHSIGSGGWRFTSSLYVNDVRLVCAIISFEPLLSFRSK